MQDLELPQEMFNNRIRLAALTELLKAHRPEKVNVTARLPWADALAFRSGLELQYVLSVVRERRTGIDLCRLRQRLR